MVLLVLSLFLYWFCHLDCRFLSIDAGCDRCHAWGRQCLLNLEHLVVLSAGPISHNSIHLLIITADFVALYWFTGYVAFIITSFLAGVESGDQCLLNSKVLSCFSGVIMSIRSFFLFSRLSSLELSIGLDEVAKWLHYRADSISPWDLVHKAKLCTWTCEVGRLGKVSNGRYDLFRRNNTFGCDGKTSKIDSVFAKLKFFSMDYDSILGIQGQVVPDSTWWKCCSVDSSYKRVLSIILTFHLTPSIISSLWRV